MPQQDPTQVAQLVESLGAASKRSKTEGKRAFSCKKTTFPVAGSDNISVDSWRFMDWDYKRSDLPTYARGLFTTKRKDGTPEIAVRGYDKFFNVDEVNSTRWRNIETNTRGPYELSVKENGCIIFISGLEDDTLLVCSKHSTGVRSDAEVSHAQAGEKWVERHVAAVGKSSKDLARELRRLNATAVGELCDDSFEEHVLAYDQAASGIYIHGINFNLPQFATLPSSEVHQFADSWGFKKANFVVYDDIKSVKEFLDQCAETGTWNGRETEGFVIRCQMSEGGGPYQDWFFKYKFEEPYLMYRQWRECTKAVIAGKLPRIKKHQKITEEYLLYARRQLAQNPSLGRLYAQNHGIISMREGFLQERGLKGSEIIAMESAAAGQEVTQNVILAPIASLGSGKTTVALALTKLFGWGHIQNDNLPKQKNKGKKFALDITNALGQSPVVFADRNNHQKRERKQLMDDVTPVIRDARFVALHYVHEPKGQLLPGIREVTRQRVLERGDNHQTIRAGTKNSEEIIGIMEGFLSRFEAVDTERDPDENFDEVINLDVTASSRENLEKVVAALHAAYPRIVDRIPSSQELDDAINWAMTDYHVQLDLSHTYGSSKQTQKKGAKPPNNPSSQSAAPPIQSPEALAKKIEYFGISLPTSEVSSLLHSLFPPSTPPTQARLYNQLVNSRRVQPAFHVTLIHRASKKDSPHIWDRYASHYIDTLKASPDSNASVTGSPTLAPARVRLERLIWDSRIMAFVARIMPPDDQSVSDWPCANALPHVTIGTASPDVKPKESNDLLRRWLEVGSGGETGIWEAEIPGVKVVQGSIGVVMSRGK
ncbi:hypothetical protein ASPWEDRAFT_36421 [Aspergillus wentii DTO 134E9]|uniref:tRNA ligase n=1 Tax=Aspergillus wentii DTO 134E9 TaxID=1073089 RepID=A0A1L9RUW6_ASPWE|nr:uncharacterized protein ASPWEDRAFT_36421 [Aspergillus wentii DTO 134E9]KAI9928647.1 hypothetical protein MW887_001862 [Aspergillus wentii]OJJ38731.1 hypothetical protein ASPWEDRAFT_36421 [Aspergillus wentii DTO 134E9]